MGEGRSCKDNSGSLLRIHGNILVFSDELTARVAGFVSGSYGVVAIARGAAIVGIRRRAVRVWARRIVGEGDILLSLGEYEVDYAMTVDYGLVML